MKPNYSFGASNSPKSFQAYPRRDFDLESGIAKRSRKPKNNLLRMIKSLGNRIHHCVKLHPFLLFLICLSISIAVLLLFSVYDGGVRMMSSYRVVEGNADSYPFASFRNLVMVAGHSVYTSSSCEKVDKEDAWYLEPYQKHPGQAATFVTHIEKGVEIAASDEAALLLFSGGETRKEAGPRSEAQSYWTVAESKQWFGEYLLCFYSFCDFGEMKNDFNDQPSSILMFEYSSEAWIRKWH